MIRSAKLCSLVRTSISSPSSLCHRLSSNQTHSSCFILKHENSQTCTPASLLLLLPSAFSSRRSFGTQTKAQEDQNQSKQLKPIQESEDENFDYPMIDLPGQISLHPIRYAIKLSQDRVEKTGSFMANLFLGKFDSDFLKYPSVLYSRKEYLIVRRQHEMVKQHFNKLLGQPKSDEILYQLGFHNLWMLSKTEMVNLFEAMGASFARPYQADNQHCTTVTTIDKEDKEQDSTQVESYQNNLLLPSTHQLLIDLMLRNLCGACHTMADNPKLGQKIKAILLNGQKIGFAWCEKDAKLGSLPYLEWQSEARLDDSRQNWVLSGEKTHIKKDNYDYYLLFCRTQHYPEDERPLHMLKPEDSNPGIVTFLIPKNLVQVIHDEDDVDNDSNEEFKLQRIKFDQLTLPREEYELFEAEEFGSFALSARAIGHLNSSAIVLGMLKGIQKEVYEHMRTNRLPLLNCQLVQQKLCEMTNQIYTIESMLYLSSAMYDCFKMESWPDMSLEANATKIVTIEYAREFLNTAQSLMGSQMMKVSRFHDLVNLLDTFLDNTIHHRLCIALTGQHFIGQYKHETVQKQNLAPFFPAFFLKYFLSTRRQRNDNPVMNLDLKGHIHPSLRDSAIQLEYCVKRMEYAAELALVHHHKRTANHQVDLWRLSKIATNLFAMTCVLSRANRSYTETLQNAETDVFAATVIIQQLWMDIRELVDEIERSGDRTPEVYYRDIHEKNLNFGGYFAYSPLEKFFY